MNKMPLLRLAVAQAISACVLFLLTFAALKLMYISAGGIPLWPIEGVTVALMLGPLRRHPLLTLVLTKISVASVGLFLGNPPVLVISIVFLYGITTYLVYVSVKKLVRGDGFFHSKGLFIFILASFFASVFLSVVQSILQYKIMAMPFIKTFFTEITANIVGFGVMAPLVIILTSRQFINGYNFRNCIKSIFIFLIYAAFCLGVFAYSESPLIYLIPLGLMLVAYKAELAVVALAVLCTVVISLAATLLGHGPFSLVSNVAIRIYAMQTFWAVITATTLPVAALMSEYSGLKRSLIAARIEAEAANQAKSVFLATISHEIRTPLNGVLGMAQVLAMDELTPVQRDRVEVVRKSGESLLSLLNDVLDLSKIEAGKLTLETIAFSLDDVVTMAVQSFQCVAEEKKVPLILDMGEAGGVYKGDPNRVRQILFNLISNALKFTEMGEVRVTCGFGPEGLWLRVTDTGIGIPPEKLGVLFSKFSQVDASTTRRFGGTGLGLSICRELAELMGGRIDLQSEVGVGSCFTLILPLERLETRRDQVEQDSTPADAEPDLSRGGLRVLAAEDNPTNQLVLKTLLQFAGIEVVIVEDGAQAVEAWARESWDIILMDVQMPVMDGPTAARAIRAREAELGLRRTPIVALTANTMSHQVEGYLAAGMDAHLGKPIEAAKLFEVIAAVAEGEAGEDASEADLRDAAG